MENKAFDSQPKTPEREKFKFKTLKNESGQFAVFKDYPNADEVLKHIAENSRAFFVGQEWIPRGKVVLPLVIGGKEINFFAKGKGANYKVVNDMNPVESSEEEESDESRNFSVLNELLVNRKASERYKQKFNKELPIEKPVGFFISSREEDKGARWVIFEQVRDIINENTLGVQGYGFRELKKEYESKIRAELGEIGISNHATMKKTYDLLAVGSIEDPKFILIDSEDWHA